MTKKTVQLLRWESRDRVLFLVDEQGCEVNMTSEDIYSALVEEEPMAGVPFAQPPAELSMSRYPLLPSVTLELDQQGAPTVGLSGHSRGTTVSLYVSDLQRGHVVVSGRWFAIDHALSSDILALFSVAEAASGNCTLQMFLRMRKAANEGAPVEDLIGENAISPLAFMPLDGGLPQVNATLYPYQLTGWRWLRFILSEGLGGLLADEMGLGKTLQIISAISGPGAGANRPCLVVAPGSLLENWRREIERFAPTLTTLKHHGPARTGYPTELERLDVVITSYDTVVRDNSLFRMIEWGVVVLDEAQYIKNPDALRTKAAKRLRRRAGLAVTGTPVENRLLDLWSIVDFVLPDQLGSRSSFEARYSNDVDGARQLESEVSPFMLRRRISEVAQDLPPRIDIPQIIEMSDDEVVRYEATRRTIAAEYNGSATLVSLTKLRMFCAHPALLSGAALINSTPFTKFQRLEEILREIFAKEEKALIFTSFTAMADLIADHITASLHAFAGIVDGRLAIDARQPLIDTFSNISGAAALVLNPRAGGTGLNITAANHVVHYNPEWNPAVEDQASARSYRRGQDLPVTVHRLLIADTVEEVISDRLERKRSIANSAVVGVSGHEDDFSDIISALSRSPSKIS